MKLLTVIAAIVSCLGTLGAAHSRYIAIPLEDVRFVELSEELVRVPRRTVVPYYNGIAGNPAIAAQLPQESRQERQASDDGGHHHHHHHDTVDYGAHTGHHGSFGWYADFPVHKGS